MSQNSQYPLSDIYTGIRMGIDVSVLKPGELRVAESDLRLRREGGYRFIQVLWWQRFSNDRAAVSVPPGTGTAIRSVLREPNAMMEVSRVFDDAGMLQDACVPNVMSSVRGILDKALERIGLPTTNTHAVEEVFVHNGGDLKIYLSGTCRRITNTDIPGADGVRLPEQCFPNGTVYGVVCDGAVASVAYGHKTGTMEDRVVDIGVVTSPAYRGRGFAKTAVSAVTADITNRGGEAIYSCDPGNMASKKTALGVGFVPYGKRLVFSAE